MIAVFHLYAWRPDASWYEEIERLKKRNLSIISGNTNSAPAYLNLQACKENDNENHDDNDVGGGKNNNVDVVVSNVYSRF